MTVVSAWIEEGRRRLRFAGEEPVPADSAGLERAGKLLPALRPVPLGLEPSFGFGDRTGLATPGHAAGLGNAGAGIRPIFAQQSIREMARTRRTPRQVMDDARFGILESDYRGPWGADADHLKTPEDVESTAAAGFVFFTIDPSDAVDAGADDYDRAELEARFRAVREEVPWIEGYRGREVRLAGGTVIRFTEEVCQRAAVKYGRAVNRAVELGRGIARCMAGRPFEIELSVDETPQPTTPAEHWIIAGECREQGLELVSLAPRYVGDFEKGVDFKGDPDAFRRSLETHAAIARELGPYKLSLHSGSDKLAVYPLFARITEGRFHVKTAGTSYLEALRAAALCAPELFRRVVDFARERYETDRATYHVSARPAEIPAPADVPDDRELRALYLGDWERAGSGCGLSDPGRQVLHCTFGSVLNHPELGPALQSVLWENPRVYRAVLEEHFARHLAALREGM